MINFFRKIWDKVSYRILVAALFIVPVGLTVFGIVKTVSELTKPAKHETDESYLEGLEDGHYDAFENLWWSAEYAEMLTPEETWETDHFSLTVTNVTRNGAASNSYEDIPCVRFNLRVKTSTMKECFEDGQFFFNAFANGDHRRKLLANDDFYWYAILEQLSENSGQATVEIYDDEDEVMLVIAVDSSLYKAIYFVDNKN